MFPGRAHLGTWRDDFRSKIQVDLQNRGKWWKIPIQAWKMMENSNPSVENDGKLMNILINRRLKSALEGSVVSQATTLLEIFWSHMSPWPQNPSTQTNWPFLLLLWGYHRDHLSVWKILWSCSHGTHVNIFHKFYPSLLMNIPPISFTTFANSNRSKKIDCYPPGHPHGLWMTIKYHTIILLDDHQWSSSSIIWLLWDD